MRHREIEGYLATDIKTLMRQGVLVAASPAERVLLRSGRYAGRSVVVRKTTRGWYGGDEEDAFFSPVPLVEDDIRQYTIGIPALVAMLRRQNDIEGGDYAEEYGLISVGRRHVDGVGAVDVYLSLANYDTDVFAARCRHLRTPFGVAKTVLLVPFAVTLSATVGNSLDAAGIVIASLWQAAQEGSLAIKWHALAESGIDQDAVVSPRKIIYGGREHACDFTAAETAFLAAYLAVKEIDVHQIMHTGKDPVIKGRYQPVEKQRNRVHQFLSRLNTKLADAHVPLVYSLPRGRDTIVQESPPSPANSH